MCECPNGTVHTDAPCDCGTDDCTCTYEPVVDDPVCECPNGTVHTDAECDCGAEDCTCTYEPPVLCDCPNGTIHTDAECDCGAEDCTCTYEPPTWEVAGAELTRDAGITDAQMDAVVAAYDGYDNADAKAALNDKIKSFKVIADGENSCDRDDATGKWDIKIKFTTPDAFKTQFNNWYDTKIDPLCNCDPKRELKLGEEKCGLRACECELKDYRPEGFPLPIYVSVDVSDGDETTIISRIVAAFGHETIIHLIPALLTKVDALNIVSGDEGSKNGRELNIGQSMTALYLRSFLGEVGAGNIVQDQPLKARFGAVLASLKAKVAGTKSVSS